MLRLTSLSSKTSSSVILSSLSSASYCSRYNFRRHLTGRISPNATSAPKHDQRNDGNCFQQRSLSSAVLSSFEEDDVESSASASTSASAGERSVALNEIRRLKSIRNVGILAHVDAGKTTVTERMLALSGVVHSAGSVDEGNTVTDYLPAERERGITIQSAAISFEWGWHNKNNADEVVDTKNRKKENVQIQLIDTPGHVDFSVEVNRSVAVLDGAVLVVDAVAGVQAQTETVWKAITRSNENNATSTDASSSMYQEQYHEPLPCVAVINKMDKDGSHFNNAVNSLRYKLPGANPIPMQMPLFRSVSVPSHADTDTSNHTLWSHNLVAVPFDGTNNNNNVDTGDFVGIVDLLHMRAVMWPDQFNDDVDDVEACAPKVIPLLDRNTNKPIMEACEVTDKAIAARHAFFEALAEIDEHIEECYLAEINPTTAQFTTALRRATQARKAVPVMAAAAMKGKGVEPVLDAIADLLPSPLDRLPPPLTNLDDQQEKTNHPSSKITLGHPLHPSLLALAFKVLHMKGRGGSGDGRVVFARIYSGKIKGKDMIHAITPKIPGELPEPPRSERVGGMLELAGGRFDNVGGDVYYNSGDVVALIGLKTVVTGDTIVMSPKKNKKGKNPKNSLALGSSGVCLSGVATPKAVLTVRLEPEMSEEQTRLTEALRLLSIEDPSLRVEGSTGATLLSGLGELHIEVILDRLHREFGLKVRTGPPAVAYRQTVTKTIETPGNTLLNFDRTIGGTRLQASVHLQIEPYNYAAHQTSSLTGNNADADASVCALLSEPLVTVDPAVREFLGLADEETTPDDELIHYSEVFKALKQGCIGALKRGAVGPSSSTHRMGSYAMTNVRCRVLAIASEGERAGLEALPGAIRASAANAVSMTLAHNIQACTLLEPVMAVEATLPPEMVGGVLSDLTSRRGTIGDVIVGDGNASSTAQQQHTKAIIKGDVPLSEIIGYASVLRSLTGGEGSFTAEYRGHAPCGNLGA